MAEDNWGNGGDFTRLLGGPITPLVTDRRGPRFYGSGFVLTGIFFQKPWVNYDKIPELPRV